MEQLKLCKNKKGGSRKGSGAKLKYGEPTTTKSFRVPISKMEELIEIVNAKLSEWTC
jgi:hypothetical protein